jgi:hypoxanthine phosphoribosyltransferase
MWQDGMSDHKMEWVTTRWNEWPQEFKLIRKTVNSKLDESHQNYISQLLEVDEDGERKTPVVGKSVGNK